MCRYGDNPHLDKCVVPLVDTYEVATQVVVVLNVFGYKRETGDFCCGSTLAFVLSEAFIDRHNSVDFKHPQVLQRWDPTGQVVVSSQTLPPGRLYLADHPEKIRTMTVQVPNDYRDNEAFWQYWSATSVSDARTCTGCFARAGDVKFKLCAQCKTVSHVVRILFPCNCCCRLPTARESVKSSTGPITRLSANSSKRAKASRSCKCRAKKRPIRSTRSTDDEQLGRSPKTRGLTGRHQWIRTDARLCPMRLPRQMSVSEQLK